jgi:hypothetical protein
MANARVRSVEPFVDRVSPNQASAYRQLFRVGYRTEGTDDVISAIDLPLQVLEEEIASGLQLVTSVSSSGGVTSQIVGSSGLTLLGPRLIASIDDLVSQAVCKDNLRLEEASANELYSLLRKLESAIGHVRAALAEVRSET